MKLWKEKGKTYFGSEEKSISDKSGRDEIIRKSGGFYNSEGGRSRDDYLHSPENRQLAGFSFRKEN